jgi:hypothetical protein
MRRQAKLKGQPRAHFGVTSNRSEFGPQKPKEFGGTGATTGIRMVSLNS